MIIIPIPWPICCCNSKSLTRFEFHYTLRDRIMLALSLFGFAFTIWVLSTGMIYFMGDHGGRGFPNSIWYWFTIIWLGYWALASIIAGYFVD